MKKTFKYIILFAFLTVFAFAEWKGQFSTIGDMRKTGDGYVSQIGLRYIPTWSLVVPWPTALFDTEISFNIDGYLKR
ncbi:MAG: hypothetical protein MUP82_00325, partial [Candidatus Marinimicrobia bacterium]|nr:hypothetical protein [Candidatus Neomarinimicrobiota bacterium]